jgi:hypothetical protein
MVLDTGFTYAVQYLEDGPGVSGISPAEARAKLRAAAERLPISMVLLGWNVPPALRDACAEETRRAGAQLYRWHPLLTGDGVFSPRPEWRVIGLAGRSVSGFRDMPEFTFVCPNRPAARDAVLERLGRSLEGGVYEGVFLDRIRYPSPAGDPEERLGCFCGDCERAAEEAGFDLRPVRDRIRACLKSPEGFLRALFRGGEEPLETFLQFRGRSVAQMVERAARLARSAGIATVGLDCFSPALARAVGQDLGLLDRHSEWIKVMTYGHTNAPAGLPFELASAMDWLVGRSIAEGQALAAVAESAGIATPESRAGLIRDGLRAEDLASEIRRARAAGVKKVLAGIELVDLEAVTRLSREQIRADARAFRDAGADGLALSWDLWHIPPAYLELV